MNADRRFAINGFGATAIIGLAAVVPAGALVLKISEGSMTAADSAAFVCMVVSIVCGGVAAYRGSGWWAVISAMALLWAAISLLVALGHE